MFGSGSHSVTGSLSGAGGPRSSLRGSPATVLLPWASQGVQWDPWSRPTGASHPYALPSHHNQKRPQTGPLVPWGKGQAHLSLLTQESLSLDLGVLTGRPEPVSQSLWLWNPPAPHRRWEANCGLGPVCERRLGDTGDGVLEGQGVGRLGWHRQEYSEGTHMRPGCMGREVTLVGV